MARQLRAIEACEIKQIFDHNRKMPE